MFPVLIYVLASAGVNADTAVGSMTKILKASTFALYLIPNFGRSLFRAGGLRCGTHCET
jgi:hypothetical protein